jgi:hypothetical protein
MPPQAASSDGRAQRDPPAREREAEAQGAGAEREISP